MARRPGGRTLGAADRALLLGTDLQRQNQTADRHPSSKGIAHSAANLLCRGSLIEGTLALVFHGTRVQTSEIGAGRPCGSQPGALD